MRAKKLKFLAHFYQKGYGGESVGASSGREIVAPDVDSAWKVARGIAASKGLVLSDVTGPDDDA